ncbi:NAD-dependent epimerase/dehydratase family protein [Ideonella paludis]|uniref:NAD-dependent epimerase/dehydratase family protein n=1 Tax=Ideonella paludis TaxID=1233411 RepID=A0ABS5DVN5_9BURK|nr:NAD-dependent epimerase/dehydratase family protein [Ideonella paludis]MBQ0935207.1 NAD-dependent epimerase/dehydratase family protein [Ideonella paludis]
MNILLCGATGFIGRRIHQAFVRAGHTVRSLHEPLSPGVQPLRFTQATCPSRWRPWLEGIDAVVNAVGVLRDSRRTPMQVVHTQAPVALFQAAADAGVRRVLHISALGLETNPRLYARSKLAAEAALLRLNDRGLLDGVVLQPSVVLGPQGASTQLFLQMARWPCLVLPKSAFTCRIQPVCVDDLAEAVLKLANPTCDVTGRLAVVGDQAMTLSDFIQSLRQQRGLRPARHWALPDALAYWGATLGDCLPFTPWGHDTLSLMSQDNTADSRPLAKLLGYPPRSASAFWGTLPEAHDRWLAS